MDNDKYYVIAYSEGERGLDVDGPYYSWSEADKQARFLTTLPSQSEIEVVRVVLNTYE